MKALVKMMADTPAEEIAATLDDILYEYAILSLSAEQTDKEAVNHLHFLRQLRNAFSKVTTPTLAAK